MKRYRVRCGETEVELGEYVARDCPSAAIQAASRTGDVLVYVDVLAKVRGKGRRADHTSTHSFLVAKCGNGYAAERMHYVAFHACPGFRDDGSDAWLRLIHRRALARRTDALPVSGVLQIRDAGKAGG